MMKVNQADAWWPGHVIMGSSITRTSSCAGDATVVLQELKEAGVMSEGMRVKLYRAATVTTRAINKMLASEA